MLDHVSIAVTDVSDAAEFYDAVFAPLGYERYVEADDMIGYHGEAGGSAFFVAGDDEGRSPSAGSHVAFEAPSRAAVDAFHRRALEAGAEDDGEPGPRPYSEHYYAAFVVDPYGFRIEAVCRQPP